MTSAEAVRTHSAVHVLKGAVVKVLGQRRTSSVHTREGGSGTLVVEMERRLEDAELRAIEVEANRKVAENAELIQFEMERQEAEGHFGKTIYDDGSPVPEEVRLLSIVRIPEWEVDCCEQTHVDTTGEVGRIRVDGARYREGEKLLELDFHLTQT